MNTDLAAVSLRPARRSSVSFLSPDSRSIERRSQLRRNADCQQAMLAALAGWLANRQTQPLFIVDGRMTVLLMNDASHRLLNNTKALSVSRGKLAFLNEKYEAELKRVSKGDADSISLSMQIAGSTVAVCVNRISLPGCRNNLLFISVSLASNGEPSHELLREKFGLTQAESQIAVAIFQGLSLVKIAKGRKASINTVKTQARHIFQKCRVNSQIELVRRLFSEGAVQEVNDSQRSLRVKV